MTDQLRVAAQALYNACCGYGCMREQDIRDAAKALGAVLAAPQPAADERVAVASSASALLAAGREKFSKAVADVIAERERQVSVEGWTPEHDDEHDDGEMARAAACYANPEIWNVFGATSIGWPWAPEWWKPKDNRRNLERAAALIIAEMERIDRAATQKGTP